VGTVTWRVDASMVSGRRGESARGVWRWDLRPGGQAAGNRGAHAGLAVRGAAPAAADLCENFAAVAAGAPRRRAVARHATHAQACRARAVRALVRYLSADAPARARPRPPAPARTHAAPHTAVQSAIFNFQALLIVILLTICTCAYLRANFPSIIDRNKTGYWPQQRPCLCACPSA
jgi:hypothetical protein